MVSTHWTRRETTAIVRAARSAPVWCPEQPWVLELRGHDVELYEVAAGERNDSYGLDRSLSCGAALANTVITVRALGWDALVRLGGGARQPDLVARVSAGRPQPANDEEVRLYHRIHSPDLVGRGHGGQDELRVLLALARFGGARLEPVGSCAVLADVLVDAGRRLDGDRRCAMELAPWMSARPRARAMVPGDGADTAATDPAPDAVAAVAARLLRQPVFAVVTNTDRRDEQVLAGAAMQMGFLVAPSLGFVPHAVVRPMHLHAIRRRLVDEFALSGCPQALLGLTPADLIPRSLP